MGVARLTGMAFNDDLKSPLARRRSPFAEIMAFAASATGDVRRVERRPATGVRRHQELPRRARLERIGRTLVPLHLAFPGSRAPFSTSWPRSATRCPPCSPKASGLAVSTLLSRPDFCGLELRRSREVDAAQGESRLTFALPNRDASMPTTTARTSAPIFGGLQRRPRRDRPRGHRARHHVRDTRRPPRAERRGVPRDQAPRGLAEARGSQRRERRSGNASRDRSASSTTAGRRRRSSATLVRDVRVGHRRELRHAGLQRL